MYSLGRNSVYMTGTAQCNNFIRHLQNLVFWWGGILNWSHCAGMTTVQYRNSCVSDKPGGSAAAKVTSVAAMNSAQAPWWHCSARQLLTWIDAEGWEEGEQFWDLIPPLHQQPLPHTRLSHHKEHQHAQPCLPWLTSTHSFSVHPFSSPMLFQAKSQLLLDVQRTWGSSECRNTLRLLTLNLGSGFSEEVTYKPHWC